MMSSTSMRGIHRRRGILEDDLKLPPQATQFAALTLARSMPSNSTRPAVGPGSCSIALPTVVLPQPD